MRILLELAVNLIARIGKINLVGLAYRFRGIGLNSSSELNGEHNFIYNILPKYISGNPVFIDIGANVGEYSIMLINKYPKAKIHAFEPSKLPFDQLSMISKKYEQITAHNYGLSSRNENLKLFFSAQGGKSKHSSIYSQVQTDLHGYKETVEEEAQFTTLDQVFIDLKLNEIDFLKIDTEGHELEVLRGAKDLLDTNRVKIIQFEFNEMNIISRTFLKDFYELLFMNFEFFRLKPKGLYPLGDYSSKNEIFVFQNIVAIRRDVILN